MMSLVFLLSFIVGTSLAQDAVDDTRYLGCFKDDNDDRIFKNEKNYLGSQTNDLCIEHCRGKGYDYAATQFGIECWCGNEDYRRHGQCISDCTCDRPCPGNPTEKCGGANAMSVYKTECRDPRKWGRVCPTSCHCKNEAACNTKTGSYPNNECAPDWREMVVKLVYLCSPCNKFKPQNPPLNLYQCWFSKCSSPSKWGVNCEKQCHCKNGAGCIITTGRCLNNECAAGWIGDNCQEDCRDLRKWGEKCSRECHCKDGAACNRGNGKCANECAPGWKGNSCQECKDPGKWGDSCERSCHCKNGDACNIRTGSCPTNECAPGWKGDSCEEECSAGTFGEGCLKTCRCKDMSSCNRTTGFCRNGQCAPGYTGQFCQTECPAGTFGDSCSKTCRCKDVSNCNKTTGFCLNGECAPGYTGQSCQTDNKITGIIAAIVVLVFILIAGAGILCACRKKRGQCTQPCKSSDNSSHKSSSNLTNVVVYENVNLGASQMLVKLEDLETVVANQKRREDPFKEEYESLSVGNIENETGSLPENKPKNRFKNIIPFDSSRVKLTIMQSDSFSDYINASYIDGYKKAKQFIASQAPTDRTLEDFWRMLWEQKVELIVMLTGLVEGAKVKCTKYWPDHGQSWIVGDITIRTLMEEVNPDYVVRELEIKKGETSRILTHMHFTVWKDYNVPDNGNALLHFHKKVKENMERSQNDAPLVVHCSAGVGRTGTFIALDYLLEQAKEEGAIDIFACVDKMRANRLNMVNTGSQYQYLYETMLEWYKVGITAIDTDQFSSSFEDKNKIRQQFQLLEEIRNKPASSPEFDEQLGRQEQNKAKNRKSKIVPVPGSQVRLMTNTLEDGDYINAAFVDGYQMKSAFIATQIPLSNTRGDFWRMVWDYKLSIVVSLFDEVIYSQKIFWPEVGQEAQDGLFIVQTKSVTIITEKAKSYDVMLSMEGKLHDVKIFTCCGFSQKEKVIPDLLEISSLAQQWRQSLQCKTILVQCMLGVKLSGIFITLSNLLGMITAEREVDIFQCVKSVRKHRPEFIQNLEEYQFLYRAVHYHLQTTSQSNIYMNTH